MHTDSEALYRTARRERDEYVAGLLRKAVVGSYRAFLRIVRMDEQSIAERELMALSDGMLRDLGIDRAEISYVVRHGRENAVPSARILALPRRGQPAPQGTDLPHAA